MRAGTVTLRVHNRLVGIRVDTIETRQRTVERFGPWIDSHDVPWAFDLALDPHANAGADPSDDDSPHDDPAAPRRGPTPLPQLRIGQRVFARSRQPDAVVDALDSLLGGFDAARREPDLGWCGMRLFTRGDDAVLLDVQSPSLLGDRALERAGITEHPAWAVVVGVTPDGAPVADLPRTLTSSPATDVARFLRFRLIGIVSPDGPMDGLIRDPESDASTLARLATRQTSAAWFTIVNGLLERGQMRTGDRRLTDVRASIEDLFATA